MNVKLTLSFNEAIAYNYQKLCLHQ